MKTTHCKHANTVTTASTHVVTNNQNIVGYQLVARVHCADCGSPFHFPNLPVTPPVAKTASANDDGVTLIVPMQPGLAKVMNN